MKIGFLIFLILFNVSCSRATKQAKKAKKTIIKKEKQAARKLLAHINRINIPRIENKEKKVKVEIWGKSPDDILYNNRKIEIIKIKTGYSIKIWYEKSKKIIKKQPSNFFLVVDLTFDSIGGFDVEVIGYKKNLMDIVYID